MNVGRPRGRVARRSRGFALVLVLWLLVLLSAIGLHLNGVGRTELRVAANLAAAARAEALADGGVAEAVFALGNANPERQWRADGEAHQLARGRDSITVTVTDEGGKVNPNLAPEQLMAALLRQVGKDRHEAASIAAAISARVRPPASPASGSPASGAPVLIAGSGPGPSTAGSGPQGTKFEAIEELLDIPGITARTLAALRPHITLDTTSPLPNEAADRVVAQAIQEFRAFGGSEVPPESTRGGAQGQGQQGAKIVSIVSIVRSRDSASFVREAVVRLDPAVPKGYVALRWERRDSDELSRPNG
jgi:general secretion pathway protein K